MDDIVKAVQGKGYVGSKPGLSESREYALSTVHVYPDGINKSEFLSKKYKTVNVSKRFYTLSSRS